MHVVLILAMQVVVSGAMHVVVSGAGPCGLLMALRLQLAGIRCTVLERAAESQLEADVGSGYDLSPSSAEILKRVGLGHTLGADGLFRGNKAMWVSSADGTVLRLSPLSGKQHRGYYVANRSQLQRMLLNALRAGGLVTIQHAAEGCNAKTTPADDDAVSARLLCGHEVVSFTEDEEGVNVEYRPRGQTAGAPTSMLRADALLGCDGVHSAVRRCLHGVGDGLRFCGAVTFWGGTELVADTALEADVMASQEKGDAFLIVTGTSDCPATIVAGVTKSAAGDEGKKISWAMTMPPEAAGAAGDRVVGSAVVGEDLTRRGGVVGAEAKALARNAVAKGGRFVQELIAGAEERKVTLVGLYDRADLDLAWTSGGGRVALLGDAAHPQSPMQGQGVNMAICDAYCVASRLAAAQQDGGTVQASLRAYDNKIRRQQVNKIVQKARDVTAWSVSRSRWVTWGMRYAMSLAPLGLIMAEVDSSDIANSMELANLDKELDSSNLS